MANPVELIPSDAVRFCGPFTQDVTVDMKIRNNSAEQMIFKMKSTRTIRFRMRPVYGVVPSRGEATVRLTCRPFATAAGVSARDRFTVMLAQCAGAVDPARAWKDASKPEIKAAKRSFVPVVYKVEPAASAPAKAQPPTTADQQAKANVKPPEKKVADAGKGKDTKSSGKKPTSTESNTAKQQTADKSMPSKKVEPPMAADKMPQHARLDRPKTAAATTDNQPPKKEAPSEKPSTTNTTGKSAQMAASETPLSANSDTAVKQYTTTASTTKAPSSTSATKEQNKDTIATAVKKDESSAVKKAPAVESTKQTESESEHAGDTTTEGDDDSGSYSSDGSGSEQTVK